MPIHVFEQFVESKTDGRACEDLIVVNDAFAALIDGASDATGAVFAEKSGGRFAAEVIAESIRDLAAIATARMFADNLTSALVAAVAETHGKLAADSRWPAASVVCVSAHRREVWRIGDCTARVAGVLHAPNKRVDDAAYGFRAAINAAMLQTGSTLADVIETDPGYVATRALLDIQQHLSNKLGPWGFGCVNGTPVPDEYLEVFPLATQPTEVILASDGYPVVHSTLGESEETLANLMSEDPASIDQLWVMGKPTRPGANAPDDRAYLRLLVD